MVNAMDGPAPHPRSHNAMLFIFDLFPFDLAASTLLLQSGKSYHNVIFG